MSIRNHIRRLNELAAPDGWSKDINLDLALWRYIIVAATPAALALGIGYLGNRGTLLPEHWITATAIFLVCMAPPILRRLYLRNQRRRSPKDSTDAL